MANADKGSFKINDSQNQFELHMDSTYAFLEFYREGEKIFLTHTEAPEKLRGTGAASELVKKSLQCCKDNGFIVVPSCSYVAAYINRNPEWRDILSDGYQM